MDTNRPAPAPRPARAISVAPHGWIRADGHAISDADAAAADAAVVRAMRGLPADWPLPYGSIVVDVDDARRAIHVRPRPTA